MLGLSISLIRKVEKECLKPLISANSDVELEGVDDENELDALSVGRLCGDLIDEGTDDLSGCLNGALVDVHIKEGVFKGKKRGVKKGVAVKKQIIFQ